MKTPIKYLMIFFSLFLFIACGNSEQTEEDNMNLGEYSETPQKTEAANADPLTNKGIGPIDHLEVGDEIDEAMASRGADLFKNMCSACHKMDKKFVGPALAGVTERRTHEWIMNMILNPEQMIKEDPIAKKLLVESNMAIMADQNLEEDETRAILEYFRSYDAQN